MRKFLLSTFLVVLIGVLTMPASVSAATKAGVKPGSFFYFFDTSFEKINLFFTFNPEKKAQKALEYADERLAEAEAVAEEKNTNAVKTALAGYESNIALAAEQSKQIKNKERAEGLLASITDNTSKHQEILSDVLNKVPDEAKEAITQAIEASKKGQEEAIKQITELKGEVEKLKQEVAELKQAESSSTEQNTSFVEIEKLKKEVEELKKKQSPIISAPKQSQQIQPNKSLSDQEYASFQQEVMQSITQTQQNINTFNYATQDANNVISIIRNEVNKYPNEYIVQSSGQELINEANNFTSISKRLVEIETNRRDKLQSFLNFRGTPPISELNPIVVEYQNYYNQYEASKSRLDSLTKNFVLNVKTTIERLTQQTKQQTEDLKTQYYGTLSQPSTDSRLEYALSELRNTLSSISNEQISSVVIGRKKEKAVQDWMQQNPNIFSFPTYINQFNAILSSYGLYYMTIP